MSESITTHSSQLLQIRDNSSQKIIDHLCVEEPLLISLAVSTESAPSFDAFVTIMRTPGDDLVLACGFFYAEGMISQYSDILSIKSAEDEQGKADPNHLLIQIKALHSPLPKRRFSVNSSCGLCGRLMIDDIEMMLAKELDVDGPYLEPQQLLNLNQKSLAEQSLYGKTGSAHAATLFSVGGDYLGLYEDVGRHNAVDKLIGHWLKTNPQQLRQSLLLVSGRSSYELVQKAVMAGIPIMASVGAPSSMALKLAQRFDLTLIGFLRDKSYNIYHGNWRIRSEV